MNTEEILYAIALRQCPNIGDVNFKILVDAVGSAKEVWQLSKNQLKSISGIGNAIVKHIGEEQYLNFAEQELKFCKAHNIKILLRHIGQLPQLLNHCYDAPALLYQKGNFDENTINISIIGTRNATNYGKEFLQNFISQLKDKNVQIISGLALGTDGNAHQEALKHNIKTSAVLAHGLHTLYPAQHKPLAQQILAQGGALFSEFNSKDKPDREHFLQRNRIIAGFSDATIVVESAYAGGSMSTATFANQYNREVYALPGNIHQKYSQGCNKIIFQNKAKIICDIASLLEDLNLNHSKSKTPELFPKTLPPLAPLQQRIYSTIETHPEVSLDELATQLQEHPFSLLPVLLELEIMGIIRTNSGRLYSITL